MASVYANGLEVSGKAQPNVSIAGFPSVCLSPPSPPAGPVPIPYPVTSTASDTADGTGSVQIKGKEVGKKNGSVYSKCDGNQPATRSFGMDVASHTLEGKTKFEAYSFDVQFERGGAERFTDITTANHSNPATAVTTSTAGGAGGAADPECDELKDTAKKMRAATDSQKPKLESELKAASTPAMKRKYPDWQSDVEKKIWSLDKPAHTACSIPGSGSRNYTANGASRAVVREAGIPIQDQEPVNDLNSKVCGGGTPYADAGFKHHTEAQMLEQIDWANPPSSITFATNWPARTGGKPDLAKRNRPCPDSCKGKLIEACKCGVKIYICTDNGQEDFCKENGVS
jgi:hypothetical protein